MKRLVIVGIVAVSLFTLSACSKSPEQKIGDFLDTYADIVIASDGDCDATAKKLNDLIDTKGEVVTKAFQEMAKKIEYADPKKLDSLKTKLDISEDKKKKIATSKCAGDPQIMAASLKLAHLLMGSAMED